MQELVSMNSFGKFSELRKRDILQIQLKKKHHESILVCLYTIYESLNMKFMNGDVQSSHHLMYTIKIFLLALHKKFFQ